MFPQIRTTLLLLVALVALVPASTRGQPSSLAYFIFGAECINGENHIYFGGEDQGGHEDVVGFDLYRSQAGTCGNATRITDVPIPRSFNQEFSHEIVDAHIVDGTLYGYKIYGVNADRTTFTSPYSLYPEFGSTDQWFAGCNAMASKGTIVDWGWTVFIEPCPGSCLPGFFIEYGAEELRPYIGLVVSVYGTLGWSIEGFGLNLESYEFGACVVSVEESGWSNVKTLFR